MASESSATETIKPGGTVQGRTDQATFEARVSELYAMRAQGYTKQSAWRKVSGPGGWGCSSRTFDRYWAKVTELLKETWSVDRQQIFHECLEGLKAAHLQAVEMRNPSASQACVMSIAKLCAVDPSVPWQQLYPQAGQGKVS
jgi:hypothetical protein